MACPLRLDARCVRLECTASPGRRSASTAQSARTRRRWAACPVSCAALAPTRWLPGRHRWLRASCARLECLLFRSRRHASAARQASTGLRWRRLDHYETITTPDHATDPHTHSALLFGVVLSTEVYVHQLVIPCMTHVEHSILPDTSAMSRILPFKTLYFVMQTEQADHLSAGANPCILCEAEIFYSSSNSIYT